MSKIVSWNVNGIRSCACKKMLDAIWSMEADYICLQEIKASDPEILLGLAPPGYSCYYNISRQKGRNGVAIYTKRTPIRVNKEIGDSRFDSEGRFLCLEFDDLTLINLYMPHGGRDKKNLQYKLSVFQKIASVITLLSETNTVIATDFNMAAAEIDVCNANQNRKNIMFTEEERSLVASMAELGYIDAFRKIYPTQEQYTWWSYAFECRKRNIGWRIDYFWVTETMMNFVTSIIIKTEIEGSDHCPIYMEYTGVDTDG